MIRRLLAFTLTLLSPALALAQDAVAAAEPTRIQKLDALFGQYVVGPMYQVLFFDLAFWDNGQTGELKIPMIVLWLVVGAVFFTIRFNFINLRGFAHAIQVTRGQYDHPSHEGEVSHFQALASALSATVGLGNIAGVAVAVHTGGPGAVFWMVIAGFLGMSSKFTECTLGQLYRETDAHGHLSGGPMRYLQTGLSELGMKGFGRVLAVGFAIMCIGGSFGGGNMFQANQSYAQVKEVIPVFQGDMGSLVYGIILALMVGAVIIGGIKRIGVVAGYIVPIMCGVYLLAGVFIIVVNFD